MITAEQIQVEPVGGQSVGPFSYEALVGQESIGSIVIDPADVPIEVFSYLAQEGFSAESMVEAMQGLATFHNGVFSQLADRYGLGEDQLSELSEDMISYLVERL